MNIRTFRPAVIGFVHIVREKHPDTPLVVISPIFSPPRETTPNAAESTLTQMRVEVAEAVDAMQDRGDTNLHYVDGLDCSALTWRTCYRTTCIPTPRVTR